MANLALQKDPDTWFLALAAMRYCIGRRSYAPSLCAGWIRRHWATMPSQTRAMMRRDLAEEVARADRWREAHPSDASLLGDACDDREWRELLAWMESRPPAEYTS